MKTLTTERLILREWKHSDLDDLYAYASRPNVGPWAGWKPHTSLEDSKAYLEKTKADGDTWAVVYKADNRVIGSVGLHKSNRVLPCKEIGYVLHDGYWGKGIMSEAVKEVIRFAFEQTDTVILTVCHGSHNPRSKRVICKCDFRLEGIEKDAMLFEEKSYDKWMYSLTKSEWLENKGRHKQNYRFYQNQMCEYFPCHKISNPDDFSCQFCFCPLYARDDCGGNYSILDGGIKDCTNCLKPHINYDGIVERLQ